MSLTIKMALKVSAILSDRGPSDISHINIGSQLSVSSPLTMVYLIGIPVELIAIVNQVEAVSDLTEIVLDLMTNLTEATHIVMTVDRTALMIRESNVRTILWCDAITLQSTISINFGVSGIKGWACIDAAPLQILTPAASIFIAIQAIRQFT